jgi:hypothetical protein
LLAVLTKSARDIYDHLGIVIATSLIWSITVALTVIGIVSGSGLGRIAFTLGWVALGPVTLATWAVGNRIARGQSAQMRDVVDGLRQWLIPGLLFFLVEILLTTLLVANLRFYFSSTLGILGHPVEALGKGIRVGHLVALAWLSPLTLWVLMQLYLPALIIEQEIGMGRALRRSAVLVLDNILFSLALAAIGGVLLGLLVLSGVGMIALFAGVCAVLTSNAVRELLTRYSTPTDQPDAVQEDASGSLASGR